MRNDCQPHRTETHVLHHLASKTLHYHAWAASDALRTPLAAVGLPLVSRWSPAGLPLVSRWSQDYARNAMRRAGITLRVFIYRTCCRLTFFLPTLWKTRVMSCSIRVPWPCCLFLLRASCIAGISASARRCLNLEQKSTTHIPTFRYASCEINAESGPAGHRTDVQAQAAFQRGD